MWAFGKEGMTRKRDPGGSLALEGIEHLFPIGLELEEPTPERGASTSVDPQFLGAAKEPTQALYAMSLEEVLDERSSQLDADPVCRSL